jgi:hypothetical protein
MIQRSQNQKRHSRRLAYVCQTQWLNRPLGAQTNQEA